MQTTPEINRLESELTPSGCEATVLTTESPRGQHLLVYASERDATLEQAAYF